MSESWPKAVSPVNIMSGFMKAGINPLNPGQITDRQTAPPRLFSPEGSSETADVISGDSTSVSSIVTRAGSVDRDTSSNVSGYISTGQASFDDILSLPSGKSKSKAKSVNKVYHQ